MPATVLDAWDAQWTNQTEVQDSITRYWRILKAGMQSAKWIPGKRCSRQRNSEYKGRSRASELRKAVRRPVRLGIGSKRNSWRRPKNSRKGRGCQRRLWQGWPRCQTGSYCTNLSRETKWPDSGFDQITLAAEMGQGLSRDAGEVDGAMMQVSEGNGSDQCGSNLKRLLSGCTRGLWERAWNHEGLQGVSPGNWKDMLSITWDS